MPRRNQLILVERRQRVCVVTLNRPAKRNSLSLPMVAEMTAALDYLAQGPRPPVLVIRGAGEAAFCAGFDIASLPDGGSAAERLAPVEGLFQSMVAYPMPVIAMLNGAAYGVGCELAVCCDIRVAAEDARLAMPPARLGLVYPWTGLRRFVQTIGLRATKEVFFTGRAHAGVRLVQLGLVDHLVPRPGLEAFALALAEEIAANAPLALKGVKRVLNLLAGENPLGEGGIAEAEALVAEALGSEDLREGRKAFAERRLPRFTGR
jgi:enoyl-CoA hydratase/carnithine racemase